MEIPTADDEKEDDCVADANRSIKFGNMPSYRWVLTRNHTKQTPCKNFPLREEKRKRKSNKLVYGALNRIQEAEERERESLRGSASLNGGSSVHSGSQQLIYDRMTSARYSL